MKKMILLAAVLVMSVSAAFSQDKIEFGAKIGLHWAFQKYTDNIGIGYSRNSVQTGFYGGGFVEYIPFKFLGFQVEALYSVMDTEGAEFMSSKSEEIVVASSMSCGYLLFPVLAKLYVFEKLSLDFGPQFGYLISVRTGNTKLLDDIDDKFDMAFSTGLSLKLAYQFDVTLRYNFGISDHEYFQAKNNVLQLGVGFRF